MRLDADRFALLDHGWLVVDGESWHYASGYDGVLDKTIVRPPADLEALVGKRCECNCHDSASPDVEAECDCNGTGYELLTVETECETCEGAGEERNPGGLGVEGWDPFDCPDCTNGTKLVRLTGQPVPIYSVYDDRDDDGIIVGDTGVWLFDGDHHPVNLDPASLIGCWAFPVEVIR